MGRSGIAVVTDYAVSNEVSGPGLDIEESQLFLQALDLYHPQICAALECLPFDISLADDGGAGSVEEAQTLL